MKRFFITFLLASFTMLFVNAQSKHTVYVWVDGEKTTIENVDSLTFIEEVAPQYVDLGLSVKWATCNLGAATPEEIGNYYAWGETTPKDTYFKNNYKYEVYRRRRSAGTRGDGRCRNGKPWRRLENAYLRRD